MLKGKLSLLLAVTAVLVGLAMPASAATIIYNNGGPNQQNGNEMTSWIQTEGFTLAAPTTITGIGFWGMQTAPGYAGSLTWLIYGDSAGSPGATIASDNPTLLGTATGTVVLGYYTEYFFHIPVSVALGAGTYHLGLHNGPLSTTDRREFYWETTNANATTTGIEWNLDYGGPWYNNDQEHAFYLETGAEPIPEPASLLLFGTGLAGLRAWKRRRQ